MFMKIIIPFKKEVVFKDNISEITSISLEHELNISDYLVKGNFIITGDYKVSDASSTVLPFNLDLPIALAIEDRYDVSKAICDIDDFYYEIVNDRKLSISIDISVDKLSEKEITETKKNIEVLDNIEEERCIDTEDEIISNDEKEKLETSSEVRDDIKKVEDTNNIEVNKTDEVNKKIKTLFNTDSGTEEYITYQIYIIREGDTVESIVAKYDIDMESLKEYNDLSDLKLGDKIIIPRI